MNLKPEQEAKLLEVRKKLEYPFTPQELFNQAIDKITNAFIPGIEFRFRKNRKILVKVIIGKETFVPQLFRGKILFVLSGPEFREHTVDELINIYELKRPD